MKTLFAIIATTVSLISVLLLAGFSKAQAQNTATVQVTAEMLEPVTITSSSGMDFGGELLPGISQSIMRTDGRAAKFNITAVSGYRININFILPDLMTHELGNDEMPITFASDAGGHSNQDDISSSSPFDPNTEVDTQVFGGDDFYIWLGGTINPRANQTAGRYTGDITIDLAYTDN